MLVRPDTLDQQAVVEPVVLRLMADNRRTDSPRTKGLNTVHHRMSCMGMVPRGAELAVISDIGQATSATRRAPPSSRWPPWPSRSICIRLTSAPSLTVPQPQPTARSSRSSCGERSSGRTRARPRRPPPRADSVIQACGPPARDPLTPLSGDGIRMRPLGYERTGRSLPQHLGSQTLRSPSIARPTHHVLLHAISAVAPRFVHKSVHKQQRWRAVGNCADGYLLFQLISSTNSR